MNKPDFKAVAAAAVIAIGAGAGAIYGSAAAVSQTAPQVAQASGGDANQSSTTLAHAVRTAEQETAGRAGKAEIEKDDGVYVYEIKTFSTDGTAEVKIDVAAGTVERVKRRSFLDKIGDVIDSEDRREDEALLKALEASAVTLSEAIEAAEAQTGGKAVKAKLKDRYGSVFFEVALVGNGSKHRVEVDTATARVVVVDTSSDRGGDDDDDDDDD